MLDVKRQLEQALAEAVTDLGAEAGEIQIQPVPDDRPGDFGSPLAFGLAKTLRKNPAAIAQELLERLKLPEGVARAEAAGPYINFFLDPPSYIRAVATGELRTVANGRKAIVEHTSVNPNKEAHVGHLRNIVLGDACARILRAAGYLVEVQNYIDDTGRQAAESIFAVDYFRAEYRPEDGSGAGSAQDAGGSGPSDGSRGGARGGPTGGASGGSSEEARGGEIDARGGSEVGVAKKYDHWLGELYVRLGEAKERDGEAIERGVSEIMHRLERGELRGRVAEVLRAQLQTYYALGAEYDLLVWESDVVNSGFLARGLDILKSSPNVYTPSQGKYAGALVMDVSEFLPGLEEPQVVLVRSDGNAVYVAKDVGYQFWKVGLFGGLRFGRFDRQPSGKELYTSSPEGEEHPDGVTFAHGDEIINVIDSRQSHQQAIVRAALKLSDTGHGYDQSHHLAYEVVTLEGQAMSGRKGITLSIDEVLAEAIARARAVVEEKNPDLTAVDRVARQVGVGALRFGMLKSEARRVIDFRWEQALSLQGDSAPYVQYAHARANSILRAAREAGVDEAEAGARAEWSKLGPLEVKLAQAISRLPEVVESAAQELAPHVVAQYALELATAWNSYYNHRDEQGKPDTMVLRSEPGLREARLLLVDAVRRTLAEALELLGIEAPEAM
ncbi:MAG: arginine--tRNA ligase [Trueperaceae bacterium]